MRPVRFASMEMVRKSRRHVRPDRVAIVLARKVQKPTTRDHAWRSSTANLVSHRNYIIGINKCEGAYLFPLETNSIRVLSNPSSVQAGYACVAHLCIKNGCKCISGALCSACSEAWLRTERGDNVIAPFHVVGHILWSPT